MVPIVSTLLLVSFAVITLAAAAQAVSGFGFAMVAVPLLALIIDAQTAVVAVTTIGITLSSVIAWRERSHIHWKPALIIAAAGLLGIPVGLYGLTVFSDRLLSILIGVIVLTFAAILAANVRIPQGRRMQVAAGATSGALLSSTGMNGPPLVTTFGAMGLPPREFRATLQIVFTMQGVSVIIGYLLTRQYTSESLTALIPAIPALVIGWTIGNHLFGRLSPIQFRRIILVGLSVSGLLILGQVLI